MRSFQTCRPIDFRSYWADYRRMRDNLFNEKRLAYRSQSYSRFSDADHAMLELAISGQRRTLIPIRDVATRRTIAWLPKQFLKQHSRTATTYWRCRSTTSTRQHDGTPTT